MAYEDRCMYCFESLNGESICPHCGRDSRAAVPQIQMLPGSLVYHDRFLVGRALGQDATGIVYAAFDTKRENKLRLREYLPRDCAERLNDGSVVPMAGMEDAFEKGMRKLRASVEGVEDPRKRHFYFEENGTAYIAQRKNAAAAAAGGHEDEREEGSGLKQFGLIVGIAAVVVVAAVAGIIALVNGALNSSQDVVLQPSLSPSASASLWAPQETPTPTPHASPTFAALVDPDQSWMDYTYNGDVEQEFNNQLNNAATRRPTSAPTIRPETTKYTNTVGGNSSSAEITSLQQRLASLGWLPAQNITGRYDDATKQAVKDFQNYVNTAIRPSEKLSVDGIAGPKTQQWLYGTDSVKPTATPTQMVTPAPDDGTVDKNSSKTDIKAVQRKLIVLGAMKPGSDDGVYGTTTTAAVKKFQKRVNELQGYAALEITGVVDPTTMAYLNYYVEWWEQQQTATPTPEPVLPTTPSPTPAPLPPLTDAPTQVTPQETDTPDRPEDNVRVDKDSPKESIQYVQQMLIAVGLLPAGSDDGVYGNGTTNAVIAFQQWVNSQVGEGTVSVTGVCDALTLNYLETASDGGMTVLPTDAPTQQVTPEPTDVPTQQPTPELTDAPTPEAPEDTGAPDVPEDNVVVDKDSPKESIQYVQQMLIAVGLLPAGSDDGVLGNGTVGAVIQFQQYVNDQAGDSVLNEDGVLDAKTLNYLEELAGQGMIVQPTQPPASVTGVSLNVGGAQLTDGVYVVTDGITFQWAADGNASYYIYVEGSDGSILYTEEATDRTTGAFNASMLTPGVMYTIRVGALPEGGSEEDMVWAQANFGIPAAAATQEPVVTQPPVGKVENLKLAINGSFEDHVLITEDTAVIRWAAEGDVQSYSVRVTDSEGNVLIEMADTQLQEGTIPASKMTPGVIYTIAVAAIPTGGGDMIWTEATFSLPGGAIPDVPETQAPSQGPAITIDGTAHNEEGVPVLTGDSAIFSWMYEEDVQGYFYYLLSSDGTQSEVQSTTGTSQTMDLSTLAPGDYKFIVGAVPVGATSEEDVVWGSALFRIP